MKRQLLTYTFSQYGTPSTSNSKITKRPLRIWRSPLPFRAFWTKISKLNRSINLMKGGYADFWRSMVNACHRRSPLCLSPPPPDCRILTGRPPSPPLESVPKNFNVSNNFNNCEFLDLSPRSKSEIKLRINYIIIQFFMSYRI